MQILRKMPEASSRTQRSLDRAGQLARGHIPLESDDLGLSQPEMADAIDSRLEQDSGVPVAAARHAVLSAAFGKSMGFTAAAMANAKAASAHVFALTIDHALVAAGVAAAIGSASFAGIMMSQDNSHPLFGGVEHLMIFAQPSIGSGADRRPSPDRAPRVVDYDATGSINRTPLEHAAGLPPAADKPDDASAAAKGYVLRLTRKGAVVVHGPKGSYAAAPGTELPDVGRILAIQNRNGRWVVLTENGVIAEATR